MPEASKKEVICMIERIPDGYHYIFVAYITLRNGKRLYAKKYGKRAFRNSLSMARMERSAKRIHMEMIHFRPRDDLSLSLHVTDTIESAV